jgi:uncharacterized membrane protein YqaE (UPF0057 family)
MRYLSLLIICLLTLSIVPVKASVLIVPDVNTPAETRLTDYPKKDRKVHLKSLKGKLKDFKKNRSAEDQKVLLAILAILLPPLAVYLHQGVINTKFWISILLTLCFWIPGVIYALLVVLDSI